jgi:hypothetical protein
MFRALLWKEWRELWVLPLLAVVIAVIALYFIRPGNFLEGDAFWTLWPTVWLPMAGAYIPTHLYSREKEIGAFDFQLRQPLDLYRAWLCRLTAGATVLVAVGVALFGITTIFHYSVITAKALAYANWQTILSSIYLALMAYSFSSLVSVFFNKQMASLVAITLVCVILAVFVPASYVLLPSPYATQLTILLGATNLQNGSLMVCPPFLFASLAVYARTSLRRQTKTYIFLGYSISAVVALVPFLIGAARVSHAVRREPNASRADYQVSGSQRSAVQVKVLDISLTGSQVVMNTRH